MSTEETSDKRKLFNSFFHFPYILYYSAAVKTSAVPLITRRVNGVGVSPGVAEDSLHASVVRVSVLHVVTAATSGAQLLLIVWRHKHTTTPGLTEGQL